MSHFLNDEQVPPMPGLSMQLLESMGEELLEELCPEALTTPMAVDFGE